MKLLVTVLVAVSIFFYVKGCNEATCRSIVTKCMLLEVCSCDLKTRVCSKECFNCLGLLYTECCSCVDMCPIVNDTSENLDKKSHIEEFPEPVPELFNVLTESPDALDRWLVIRYPVEIDALKKKKPVLQVDETNRQPGVSIDYNDVPLTCVVVFWGQCMSWTKCRNHCVSMGSSSYRWFHNGCCECIGPNCINYGINESKCKLCQSKNGSNDNIDGSELTFGEDNVDELDYGDGDYNEDYDDLREEDFEDDFDQKDADI